MRKRISFLIILLVALLFFNISASAQILPDSFQEDITPFKPSDSEFHLIYGNRNLEEDYLYHLKYIPYDNTEDSLNGVIAYDYVITDKYNHQYDMIVEYGLTNSFGSSLKVSIGSTVIYSIEVTDVATIYQLSEFDFYDYTDSPVHIQSFSYKSDFISDDMDVIALTFAEETDLCYLDTYSYSIGKTVSVTVSDEYATPASEIVEKSLLNYEYITKSEIIYTDYYPASDKIKPGNYVIKYALLDVYGNVYVDTYQVKAEDDKNYFLCDDIEVDSMSFISSENIFKYYVHFYDKENVTSYDIISEYKTHASIMGVYTYQAVLYVGDEKLEYAKEATITVRDLSIPELTFDGVASGDGSYLSKEEMFLNLKAMDGKDGNITDLIEIRDIDNYEENYDKEGTYSFVLSVADKDGNETVKYFSHTVTIEKEPDPLPEEEEEIKTEEEREILYEFYTTPSNPLTRALFRQKLVFSGFYADGDSVSIASDYFENKETLGTYLVSVTKDSEIRYFNITVNQDVTELIENETETVKNSVDSGPIIVGVSVLVILISVLIYVIVKRYRKKETQD